MRFTGVFTDTLGFAGGYRVRVNNILNQPTRGGHSHDDPGTNCRDGKGKSAPVTGSAAAEFTYLIDFMT